MRVGSRPAWLLLIITFIPSGILAQRSATQQPPDSIGPPPLLVPTEPPKTDAEVVRVETDLVTTLFTAFDKEHNLVTSLSPSDIQIRENGVQQEITIFEKETDRPLSFVVLIDTSKSQESTLPAEKLAAKAFVQSVVRPGRDLVSVVSFTGVPELRLPPTDDVSKVAAAIEALEIEYPPSNPKCQEFKPVYEEPLCWTSLWDAVWASTKGVLAKIPKETRRAIILLTDGDDTSSVNRRDDVIEFVLANSTIVYGVGIGDRKKYPFDKDAIKRICERTGGRAFFPNKDMELTAVFSEIKEELRSQYVIGYTPKNRARDGSFREIKIEITNPELRKRKLKLVHSPGYYALGK